MYATGHPDYGLGRLLREQGRFEDARYRFERIEQLVVPNTLRLLEWARANDMRRVFLTYGSEVEDYSDLGPQMLGMCKTTRNRKGLREHELLDELAPQPNERVINKITPSAFTLEPDRAHHAHLRRRGPDLHGRLDEHVRRGHACATRRTAASAASWSTTPRAPTRPEYHEAACVVLQRLYGHVMQTDDVLARLEGARSAPGEAAVSR